jgi:outer membrane protein
MRRFVLVLAVCLGLFLITDLAYSEDKSAYVDLGRVFDEYSKTQEYDKVLNQKQKAYEQERETKLEEVKKLQEKLSLLSDEEKESRKSDLEGKISQLQEFDRSSTQDLRKNRDEKIKEIFKDINQKIEDYAKKQGLTFVFDSRALIYVDKANKSLDITDNIIKELNK